MLTQTLNQANPLAQLQSTQLVHAFHEEENAYMFKHALTQDAAYQMLLVKQRREIHRQVARTIESLYANQLDDNAAILARHYLAAHDDAKTSEYSIRAGERAMQLYAFAEARFHFSNAVDALGRLPDELMNRRKKLTALIHLTHASAFAEDPARNFARLAEAEKLAQSLIEQEPSIRQQLAQVYYWLGFMNLMRNETRTTHQYYQQAHELAQQVHDDRFTAQLALEFALVLNLQGRFGDAEPLIIESVTLMQNAGKPLEDVIALAQWGLALAGRGNYAEGLKQAQDSLARVQSINFVYGIEVNNVLLAWIYFLGGDMIQSLQAAQQAVQLAQAAGDWIQVFTGSVFAAWASSRLGQHSVAQAIIAQIQAMVEKSNAQLVGMEVFMAAHAEIELNANQIDKALMLASLAVTAAQANAVVFAEGIAQRVWAQALMARNATWDEIESHLIASLDAFEKGDVHLEVARTHLAWGKAVQAHGDANVAREHLEKAAAQFQTSGLATELAQVRHLLDEVGVAS